MHSDSPHQSVGRLLTCWQGSRQAEPRENASVEADQGADPVTGESEDEKAGEVPDAVG